MNIAVIGAGMAGLCAAKHAMQNGYDVTVFEQTAQVGGTWVYTDTVGKDKYGLDVHTSMYEGLRTNIPKEIMGFPDFPIPDQEKSYISADDVLDFIKLYTNAFRIDENIKFEHYVIRVRPIGASQWEIIYRDLARNQTETAIYDAVLVCNGINSIPNIPDHPGKDDFGGLQIHSHDYRSADRFKDESVLIVGGGPSGRELAYQIAKKAKRVTLSHHREPEPESVFPSNAVQVPDVKKITETGAEFVDGTHQTFSAIIHCTGYKYSFPFLSIECRISVDDNYIHPLYKQCININWPTMAIIGAPYYVFAGHLRDLQIRFFFKYLSGGKALPSKSEMLKDTEDYMQQHKDIGLKKYQSHFLGPNQNVYYEDLATTAEIEPIKPVMPKLYNQSVMRLCEDMANFRNDVYRLIDDDTYELMINALRQ